jgi:hypothetical protein
MVLMNIVDLCGEKSCSFLTLSLKAFPLALKVYSDFAITHNKKDLPLLAGLSISITPVL